MTEINETVEYHVQYHIGLFGICYHKGLQCKINVQSLI